MDFRGLAAGLARGELPRFNEGRYFTFLQKSEYVRRYLWTVAGYGRSPALARLQVCIYIYILSEIGDRGPAIAIWWHHSHTVAIIEGHETPRTRLCFSQSRQEFQGSWRNGWVRPGKPARFTSRFTCSLSPNRERGSREAREVPSAWLRLPPTERCRLGAC